MITGALWSIGYSIVCIGFAYWHFLRKDITELTRLWVGCVGAASGLR